MIGRCHRTGRLSLVILRLASQWRTSGESSGTVTFVRSVLQLMLLPESDNPRPRASLIVNELQPVLGFSHLIVCFLSIPRGTTLAYLVHLTTAFAISAFFHGLSLSVICSGYLAVKDLVTYMAIFFMSQPVATLVETLAIHIYRNLVLHQHQPAPGDTTHTPKKQKTPKKQHTTQTNNQKQGNAG